MTAVRLATFNVENLFARFKFNKGIDPNKAVTDGWKADQTSFTIFDEQSKKITGQAIKATKADILCLQEVEGGDSLKRFRNEYLGGSKAYPYYALIDGNDPRWIDVAFLSKFPILSVTSWQHVKEKGAKSFVFSRDCLEADIELPDGSTLTLYGNHFKSMMGGRAQTKARRELQAKWTRKIVEQRFGKDAGKEQFAILGDLNDYMDDANGISEVVNWQQVENVLERLPDEEQWTHYYDDEDAYAQLDYILLSTSLANRLTGLPELERRGLPTKATRVTTKRFAGVGKTKPKASDHCPFIVEFEV